jgi:hypothetical protein
MGSAWKSRFAWTDEHEALALRMWNEGHSFTEIAARLGCHSRSAVGAKLARLGAPKRDGSERKWDSLTEHERARARTAAKAATRPPRPQQTGRCSLTERTWGSPSMVKLRCLEGADATEPDLPNLRTIKRPMRPYEAAAREFLRRTGWRRVGNRYVRREPSPVFAGKEWAA